MTVPFVFVFRDAIMDLFAVELGCRFVPAAEMGLQRMLNFVGAMDATSLRADGVEAPGAGLHAGPLAPHPVHPAGAFVSSVTTIQDILFVALIVPGCVTKSKLVSAYGCWHSLLDGMVTVHLFVCHST